MYRQELARHTQWGQGLMLLWHKKRRESFRELLHIYLRESTEENKMPNKEMNLSLILKSLFNLWRYAQITITSIFSKIFSCFLLLSFSPSFYLIYYEQHHKFPVFYLWKKISMAVHELTDERMHFLLTLAIKTLTSVSIFTILLSILFVWYWQGVFCLKIKTSSWWSFILLFW